MHKLSLEQRTSAKITGVIKVNSFDENIIVMDTEEGLLNIKGKDLHVSRLTLEKGEADIDGKIDSLIYMDKKSTANRNEGLLKHLFS
jgi:sporulation protein YabP